MARSTRPPNARGSPARAPRLVHQDHQSRRASQGALQNHRPATTRAARRRAARRRYPKSAEGRGHRCSPPMGTSGSVLLFHPGVDGSPGVRPSPDGGRLRRGRGSLPTLERPGPLREGDPGVRDCKPALLRRRSGRSSWGCCLGCRGRSSSPSSRRRPRLRSPSRSGRTSPSAHREAVPPDVEPDVVEPLVVEPNRSCRSCHRWSEPPDWANAASRQHRDHCHRFTTYFAIAP